MILPDIDAACRKAEERLRRRLGQKVHHVKVEIRDRAELARQDVDALFRKALNLPLVAPILSPTEQKWKRLA